MRFSTRTLFAFVAFAAILAALVGGAIRLLDRTYDASEDFYAIHQTHDMLYRFIGANEGTWPTSWDELVPYFDMTKNTYWCDDIDSLKELIDIDFTLNFQNDNAWDMRSSSASPKLLSLRSDKNNLACEELEKVNRRLFATLHRRQGIN